jgi:hypothetical protein
VILVAIVFVSGVLMLLARELDGVREHERPSPTFGGVELLAALALLMITPRLLDLLT